MQHSSQNPIRKNFEQVRDELIENMHQRIAELQGDIDALQTGQQIKAKWVMEIPSMYDLVILFIRYQHILMRKTQ